MNAVSEKSLASAVERKFLERNATVAVVGLGYVGLPLARSMVEAGFKVIGLDTDPAKPVKLAANDSYIRHLDVTSLFEAIAAKKFEASCDFSLIGEADAIIICVPTPLTRHREPDLSYVANSGELISRHMRRGQLVVLESTSYPGTTREVLVPALEKSGLACGRDFFVGYSPEREDPGNAKYSTGTIPKVVAGLGPEAGKLVAALYSQFIKQVVPVSSLDAAEAVKITENIFRAVNIALVNELKTIYSAMGIDIWEVIEAAKTKPFGFMPFYPGPGLGGHCIPIDPFYLTWKAREFDAPTRFIELAGEINTAMPRLVVDTLVAELAARFAKSINGAKILVLGLAYKPDIDDIRESPSLRLLELLESRGARVEYHDPYVPSIPETREHRALAGRASVPLPEHASEFDAALIATDHKSVDYARLVKTVPLVVDTRNVIVRTLGECPANVVKA